MQPIGEKIRALRRQKGMTQEAMAETIGVSRQAVSRWETGEVLPDAENLKRLAALLQTPVDSLLQGEVTVGGRGLPVREDPPQQKKGRQRIVLLVAAGYLLAVFLFFLVTRSVMVSYAYLLLGGAGALLYLLARFLRRNRLGEGNEGKAGRGRCKGETRGKQAISRETSE